jgi:hypothetical protein
MRCRAEATGSSGQAAKALWGKKSVETSRKSRMVTDDVWIIFPLLEIVRTNIRNGIFYYLFFYMNQLFLPSL